MPFVIGASPMIAQAIQGTVDVKENPDTEVRLTLVVKGERGPWDDWRNQLRLNPLFVGSRLGNTNS